MNRLSISAICAILFTTAIPAAAFAEEPTEAEMRAALQSRIDTAKQGTEQMKNDGCDKMRGGQSQDMMAAFNCLMGAAGSSVDIGISAFEKVACEKADAPGYICDYIVAMSSSMTGPMQPAGTGQVVTKRFVKSKSGWIAIDQTS
ncbi:MAG: hypothetical protein AAGD40_05515 [Pseudomonadota bacterium]